MKTKMATLARRGHSAASEAKRAATRSLTLAQHAATDAQRGRLRDSSILVSQRVRYDKKNTGGRADDAPRTATRATRVEHLAMSRLEALAQRRAQHHPARYRAAEWKDYRLKSTEILQPYYPNSARC